MTDAHLMDAECIHGNVWYECEECDAVINRERKAWVAGIEKGLNPIMGHGFEDRPNPGSDAAITAGCTCPVLDNNHGKYPAMGDDGWWIAEGCPIHNVPDDD